MSGGLRAPAPWHLDGRGYISLLKFDDARAQDAFLPESLRGRRLTSPYAWMMFVDYASSNVGPYHELLFIPGQFPFADGQWHLSISRILVSSQDSVDNGQRNWGIPKERAEFDVDYGQGGIDRVRVQQNGQMLAELDYRNVPIPLPFSTRMIPQNWRTLGQHRDGQTYIYRPSARGWMRPATLLRARSNPALFVDLARSRSPLSVKVSDFSMAFPLAQVLDGI